MGRSLLKILYSDCDPSMSEDKNLPYTAYLIEYLQDETTKFDIAVSNKKSEIFDHYWDNYRNNFINMTQTEGRVNPKLWGAGKNTKKGKK